MKKLLPLFTALFFLTLAAWSQTSDEVLLFSYFTGDSKDGLKLAYSYDGLTWTSIRNNQSFLVPGVGQDKLMRDPSVYVAPDGRFHMVWTLSWKERGIGYASSADLIHWSEQTYIPVMEHEPAARNTWAPEIFYDDLNSRYMIYWATTITGKFPETQVEGDNGLNHRIYYVTTTDFKTFSDTRLLLDPGFNCIDAVIFKAGGQYHMIIKDETIQPEARKYLRHLTSDRPDGGWSAASEPISKSWVEGPSVTQNNGKWLIYFDQYRMKKMGAIESANLTDWSDISDQITFPAGTRHGTCFKVNKTVLERLLAE